MPRPKQMTPVEKIEQDILSKKLELADLEKEKEIVLKYWSSNGIRVSRVGRPKKSVNKATARIETVMGMTQLVKEKKRPLSIDEFYEGLKSKGWTSSNKDPKKTIWAAIGRGGFKKTKPGYYTVRG